MEDILARLDQEAGIRGSLLLSSDGVAVASRLGAGLDEERVAALFSYTVRKGLRSFEKSHQQPFEHVVISSTFGKVVIVNAGVGYLVVVTDPLVNLGATLVEVLSAGDQIRKRGRLVVAPGRTS